MISIAYDDIEEDVYRFSPKKKTASSEDEEGIVKPTKKKKGTLDVKATDGDKVKGGDTLFITADGIDVKARRDGVAKLDKISVKVCVPIRSEKEYIVPAGSFIIIKDGDSVQAGDSLTEGSLDLQTLFKFKGKEAAQKYIINEIQHIYSSLIPFINSSSFEV